MMLAVVHLNGQLLKILFDNLTDMRLISITI